MPAQAPIGGIVSCVNGQFYDGGRFIPDHGKFCGKGRNRVTLEAFSEVSRKVEASGFTLEYEEKWERFTIRYPGGNILRTSKNLKTLVLPPPPKPNLDLRAIPVNPI